MYSFDRFVKDLFRLLDCLYQKNILQRTIDLLKIEKWHKKSILHTFSLKKLSMS